MSGNNVTPAVVVVVGLVTDGAIGVVALGCTGIVLGVVSDGANGDGVLV